MIDGRHCTMDDYIFLNEKTNEIICYVSINKISEVDYKISDFLHLVARFDRDIAGNMRTRLRNCRNELQVLEVINSSIDHLRHLVLVDINEHR